MVISTYTQVSYVDILRRSNRVASYTDLTEMLDALLDLLLDVTGARAGQIYLYDAGQHHAVFIRARMSDGNGAISLPAPLFPDYLLDTALLELLLRSPQPLLIQPQTLCAGICFADTPVGAVQLQGVSSEIQSNGALDPVVLVQIVLERLAADIVRVRTITQQTRLLAGLEQSNRRLSALNTFITRISTTLNRNHLIQTIMNYAEELLNVEATSFWLLDKTGTRLHLLVAAGNYRDVVSEMSIAADQGVIGHVVTHTQQREIVNNVEQHPHFNREVDLRTGFVTRSMLCVPMRAPTILRDIQRSDSIHERIIGGAQALNKRDQSGFTEEDAQLFETLTRQAAIAFQLSQMFEEEDRLFWGIVKTVSMAADMKDPSYSQGHSRRVSHVAVEIARELGCNAEQIARIRIGSRLHDLGKIGISDMILSKKGQLDANELDVIRQHPAIGFNLLQDAGLGELLSEELKAVIEHHERLDGTGYPRGLKADEISLIGRIVAVADVFDALTSDRPYRSALSITESFEILQRRMS
ncbi:MAG: GAF domain-containing protein, partial [Chloroflexaceae bacterium]|nr:GAF domain-containing protein [Chloroflexaceae bacterium]